MLRHAHTRSPLVCEVEANAHRRAPLACSALPRLQLVQRRGFHAGLLGEKQLAGSVASRAMAPLLSGEVSDTQAEGPAGKFAKLQVLCGWCACQCVSIAGDTRLCAVHHVLLARAAG